MLNDDRRTTVTLSGVVGAGKSSAAKAIVQSLRSAGFAAEHIRFQEFTGFRARPVTDAEPKPPGDVGRKPAADKTRWKGYARRRLTARIAAGYVLRTWLFRARLRRWPKDTVLVFDRYFYDSLVHFDLSTAGIPLKVLLAAIPAPTVAALLLIRDTTILERRSRYAPEYARQAAEGYEALPERLRELLVVQTDEFASVGEVTSRIVARVLTRIGRRTDG